MGRVAHAVSSAVGAVTHVVSTGTNSLGKTVSGIPVVGGALQHTVQASGGILAGQSPSQFAGNIKGAVAPVQEAIGSLQAAGIPVGAVAAAATGDPALAAGISAIGSMPGAPPAPRLNGPAYALPPMPVSGINQVPFFSGSASSSMNIILPAALALGAVVLIAKGRRKNG